MKESIRHNGNVQFADIQIGDIVSVGDYYNLRAVGIVEEKKETRSCKSVKVRCGFFKENDIDVIIDEILPTNGEPMYQLLEIIHK